MRKYIPAIASFFLGNGVAGVLAWLGQTTPALFISIIFTVIGIGLFLYYFLRARGKEENVSEHEEKFTRKEEARVIHQKIVKLDTKLWDTKDKLVDTEDLQQNEEIKHIMDEMLTEINKLGYLINNSDFDKFAESLLRMYSHFLEFHMDVRDPMVVWSRARINSKFRWFINRKVKG